MKGWKRESGFIDINTTSGLNGFRFPDSAKPVNVAPCRTTTTPGNTVSNVTTAYTTTHGDGALHNTSIAGKTTAIPTEDKESICGPGFAVIVPLLALAFRRFRE